VTSGVGRPSSISPSRPDESFRTGSPRCPSSAEAA
jgi:hypothetical protein